MQPFNPPCVKAGHQRRHFICAYTACNQMVFCACGFAAGQLRQGLAKVCLRRMAAQKDGGAGGNIVQRQRNPIRAATITGSIAMMHLGIWNNRSKAKPGHAQIYIRLIQIKSVRWIKAANLKQSIAAKRTVGADGFYRKVRRARM